MGSRLGEYAYEAVGEKGWTGGEFELWCSCDSGLTQSLRKLRCWDSLSELSQIEVRGLDLCPPTLTSHPVDCPREEAQTLGEAAEGSSPGRNLTASRQ